MVVSQDADAPISTSTTSPETMGPMPAGGAGGNQVAGDQGHGGGDELQHFRDARHKESGAGSLTDDAV
jgi:hypothetical protein